MAAAALEPNGAALYAQHCSIAYCHGPEGSAGRAPAIRGTSLGESGLRRVIIEGIPGTSMPPFGKTLGGDEVGALVDYLRSLSPIEPSGPAPAGGASLFYDSSRGRCAACHRFGREDFPGPDLAKLERNPTDILRDIVDPSASINATKAFVEVVTVSGDRFRAIREEETESYLRVHDLSVMPPVLRRISKEQIERVELLPGSAMPEGLGEKYNERELEELALFIYSSR
jgi:putative heme-binding domain-containing protein